MTAFGSVPASVAEFPMPMLAQTVTLAFGTVAIAVLFVVAVRQCRRHRSVVPLLLLLAGFCTVAQEPIVGVLGHGVHPVRGQIPLFEALGRSIPLHIGLVYTFYYGAMYVLLYPRLVAGTMTQAFAWRLFWATVAGAFVFEVVPLQIGLWTYYDPQALWIWRGGMPVFWVVANAVSLMVPLAMIKISLPLCSGWKQWWVVPLSPMGAIMGHVGTGFPFYLAGNADVAQWVVDLSGLASLALGLLTVSVCVKVLSQQPQPLSHAARLDDGRYGLQFGKETR